MKKTVLTIVGMAVFGLGHIQAQTILYQDTFQDTNNSLNGQAPTTAVSAFGASASATWSGGRTEFTESTSINVLSITNTSGNIEYLTFTPQSGLVYTLSATVTNDFSNGGDSDNWMAFGFITNTGSQIYSSGSGGAPWILLKPTGVVEAYGGPGTAGGNKTASTGAGILTGNTMTITLDTTTTLWTYKFSYLAADGTTLLNSATTAYTTNPTIAGVGLSSYAAATGTRTLDDFTLTATAIPEPSTYALMVGATGLVTTGVLRYRRRSQRG
jgi:hypothetical protein